ncbi:MAG: septum formation initiator family protein [Lachnospiraceae bacterium]|nr:septum formation initiator family protein [Lachnospiraceae bacterium]
MTLGISLIVMVFVAIMCIQIKDSKQELRALERQEQALQLQLEDAQDEAEYLEERKVYVQTKKYVEEVAKKIGYVYQDEIIYKPED